MTIPKMVDGPGSDLPVFSPVCSTCRHLRWDEGRTCAAFPAQDSIPLDIWLGRDGHRRPVPGDHGIRYERITPEEARARGEALREALGPRPETPKRTQVP